MFIGITLKIGIGILGLVDGFGHTDGGGRSMSIRETRMISQRNFGVIVVINKLHLFLADMDGLADGSIVTLFIG